MSTKQDLERIYQELEEMKRFNRSKNIQGVLKEASKPTKLLIQGYILALEKNSDFHLKIDSISIKQVMSENKIIINLDIQHFSKFGSKILFNKLCKFEFSKGNAETFESREFFELVKNELKTTTIFDYLNNNNGGKEE